MHKTCMYYKRYVRVSSRWGVQIQFINRYTWTASLVAVLVQRASLSCLWRTVATTPQISSLSSNCSPIIAINYMNPSSKKKKKKLEPMKNPRSKKNQINIKQKHDKSKQNLKKQSFLPFRATWYQDCSFLCWWQTTFRRVRILGLPIWVRSQLWSSGNRHSLATCWVEISDRTNCNRNQYKHWK